MSGKRSKILGRKVDIARKTTYHLAKTKGGYHYIQSDILNRTYKQLKRLWTQMPRAERKKYAKANFI